MSWDNMGTYWHIDHVKPCASFDLNEYIEIKKCYNWTNLQPLSATDNAIKHAKVDEALIKSHTLKAEKFKLHHDVPRLVGND
jgi:hypothetical protein